MRCFFFSQYTRGCRSNIDLASGNNPATAKRYEATREYHGSSQHFGRNVIHGNMPPPYMPPQVHTHGPYYVHSSYQNPPQNVGRYSPPPSYQEVDGISRKKISSIVKALALLNGQWATAENIGKLAECDSNTVEKVVKANRNLFSAMNDGKQVVIELVPDISICMDYLSEKGCKLQMVCGNLHICKYFIFNKCTSGTGCHYGHKWDTSHNSRVLSKFYLDEIDKNVLLQVMKKIFKGILPPQICNFYNSKNGCKYGEKCGQLHICKQFVSSAGKCLCSSYNHDILTPHCKRILKSHDLSINESPRDIIMSLKAVLIKEEEKDDKIGTRTINPSDTHVSAENDKGKKKLLGTKNAGNATERKAGITKNDPPKNTKKVPNGEKPTEDKPQKGKRTCWSTDVLGDVKIPEICVFSIDDKCRNEKKGCDYLHAKSLFHWQAKQNQHWYNFRIFQSKMLESAYRDVSKGTVAISPLIASKLGNNAKELLSVFGTRSWTADFQAMTIRSLDQEELQIRRIATKSAAESTSPKATVYKWHFIDDQGKWIRYGDVDSLGKQKFVCSVTSEEIEEQFLSDSSSWMEISNSEFKYKLDFSKMRQINLNTRKEREIRRRPAHLSYQKRCESDQEASLPSHWNPMPSNQTHTLQHLDASSSEYLDIARLVRMTLPTLNVVSIQRLQNPYLWRLFQYKIANLSQSHNENQMNIQKLFHAVEPLHIDTICKENFDWRQAKTRTQEFGKGAYFSNRACVTRNSCTPNRDGRFFLFVAQVIVGDVEKGSPDLTRPPFNPVTNSLYNTTVDDVHNTTIFVKYDKEDYYPEYLVEFF
ncbi:protein mono-ADP-ribosyltransferase PARP12-like isoform X2 [Penaeus indicus]|uniref:protein mono-ADP-ribosyltransferase PARP12-like isoform X2 n=1 Tax=Penaeus indicus TaxID=29960 RepID=UPI00300D831A